MKPISNISIWLYIFGYKTKECKAWRAYWAKQLRKDKADIDELNLHRERAIRVCELAHKQGVKHTFNPEMTFNKLVNQGYSPRLAAAKVIMYYGDRDAKTVTGCA